MIDVRGRREVDAFLQRLVCGAAQKLQRADSQPPVSGGFLLFAQILRPKFRVFKTIEQEIHQIGHYGLGSFRFQKVHQSVVGGWRKFYQNLPHDADPGFLFARNGDAVKCFHNLCYR